MKKIVFMTSIVLVVSVSSMIVNADDIKKQGSSAPDTTAEVAALDGFNEYVEEVQKIWKAPGIAVGIVQGGKAVYSKGFGYRDVENKFPVTPNTLFSIASSTKAFTSTGIGILVDEGKVTWDTRLNKCLPWFQLKDPVANEYATVRDMLCHRIGLPAHTLNQFSIAKQYDRREIARRIRYLEPNIEFRTNFQYQNQMYQVATVAIEELSGQSWEDFTRQRIFEPLGMNRSRFSISDEDIANDGVSLLYKHTKEGGVMPTDTFYEFAKEISGSGSIHSSVSDMCNWLIMNLQNGQFGDKQIVSPGVMGELFNSHTVISGVVMPELLDHCYTLGWNSMVYRGHLLLNRPGGGLGTASQVAFMPMDGIGIVILGNAETSIGSFALMLNAFDRLLGLEPIPWLERLGPYEENSRQYALQLATSTKEPRPDEPPTHALTEYIGVYENPGYGKITITLENDGLIIDFIEKTHLRHLYNNVFDAFQLVQVFDFRFETDIDGNIKTIVAPLEPSVEDIVFKKIEKD